MKREEQNPPLDWIQYATHRRISGVLKIIREDRRREGKNRLKEDTAKFGFIEQRDDKKGRTKVGLSIYIITYIK